jgi:hypothetical protein
METNAVIAWQQCERKSARGEGVAMTITGHSLVPSTWRLSKVSLLAGASGIEPPNGGIKIPRGPLISIAFLAPYCIHAASGRALARLARLSIFHNDRILPQVAQYYGAASRNRGSGEGAWCDRRSQRGRHPCAAGCGNGTLLAFVKP